MGRRPCQPAPRARWKRESGCGSQRSNQAGKRRPSLKRRVFCFLEFETGWSAHRKVNDRGDLIQIADPDTSSNAAKQEEDHVFDPYLHCKRYSNLYRSHHAAHPRLPP